MPRSAMAGSLCPTQDLLPFQPAIQPVTAYCYLEDPGSRLQAADILGGEYKLDEASSGELVFSATRSRYWIYLELHNRADHLAYWNLSLNCALFL